MIKGSILQDNQTLVNIYVPSIGTPECIEHLWQTKKEKLTLANNSIGFNTQFKMMDKSSRQKISKGTLTLYDILARWS